MLAAKIHLNQGNYGEVETLTDDIIGSKKFKLYDDYYNLFKIPGKVCDESLFECQCTDFGLGSGDMVDADNWFVFQGPANDGNNNQYTKDILIGFCFAAGIPAHLSFKNTFVCQKQHSKE